MDLDNTLAIKVSTASIPAKACMALKQLTGLSLAEVKGRVANDEFLFVCDYIDDDGLKLINKIKREMKKFDIEVRQFEDGVEKSPELFDNIEELHEEIDQQYSTFID